MAGRIVRTHHARIFSPCPALAALVVAVSTGVATVRAAPFEVVGDMPSVLANPAHAELGAGDALDGRMATGSWDGSSAAGAGDDQFVGPVEGMSDAFASSTAAVGTDACRPAESCHCAAAFDPPGLVQHLVQCHDRSKTCWSLRAESLILWRSSPRDRPLFSSVDAGTVAGTALDAGQLVSDPLAAPRLSLFRDDGCGPILEGSYLWAGNFYSQRSLPFVEDGYATSPPGIYGNTWGPPDTALNAAQAKLLGNVQSAELNVRERFLRGAAQFLVGFRWLQWNESLQMQDSYSQAAEVDVITGNDLYRTDCFNNLYGGQIGIDAILLGHKPGFHIDGLVKAGAFYNDASQRSTYAYANTSPFEFATSNRAGSPDGAAFVGEVGMTAVIPVQRNLDLRVGYFGLWIEGLAQPTNQLSKQTLTQVDPPSGTLDTTGGVLLQGLSLGLEGRW